MPVRWSIIPVVRYVRIAEIEDAIVDGPLGVAQRANLSTKVNIPFSRSTVPSREPSDTQTPKHPNTQTTDPLLQPRLAKAVSARYSRRSQLLSDNTTLCH